MANGNGHPLRALYDHIEQIVEADADVEAFWGRAYAAPRALSQAKAAQVRACEALTAIVTELDERFDADESLARAGDDAAAQRMDVWEFLLNVMKMAESEAADD